MNAPDGPHRESDRPDADADTNPGGSGTGQRVDYVALAVESRQRRKSFRELPRLVNDAFALLWSAGKATTLTTLVVQALTTVSLLAQILLVKEVLEVVLVASRGDGSMGSAVVPVALLALLAAVTSIGSAVSSLQQRVLGNVVGREVWRRTLAVTEVVDLVSFEDPDFHDQVERVNLTAASQTLVITQAIVALAGGVLGGLAGAVAVLALAPTLLPLLLVSGIPLYLASRRAGRMEFDFAVRWSAPGRQRVYLQELLTARHEAKEVRAFSLSGALRERWEVNYGSYIADLQRHIRARTKLMLLGNGLSAVLTAATLLLVLLLVQSDRLGIAQAGAALVAVRLLSGRVNQAAAGLSAIFESALFLEDLEKFLRRRPDSLMSRSTRDAPADFEEIDFLDVSFSYPQSVKPSLLGVNMHIRRGEVVAIVGENGSGKTTLAKLLASLYEPSSGSITWDGLDVRTFNPESLRRRTSVIFQDFVRYKLTARDNVGLGLPSGQVDDEALRSATTQSGAAKFLEKLPLGYDTILSTEYVGGVDLSLGQWQRVALARAFARDAPLVILDEPSAALDARAEHDLFERIRSLLAGRTVLLISHRFSTVQSADQIYVLKEGQVVESGTHADLMSDGGLYAELFTLQANAYATAQEGNPMTD